MSQRRSYNGRVICLHRNLELKAANFLKLQIKDFLLNIDFRCNLKELKQHLNDNEREEVISA